MRGLPCAPEMGGAGARGERHSVLGGGGPGGGYAPAGCVQQSETEKQNCGCPFYQFFSNLDHRKYYYSDAPESERNHYWFAAKVVETGFPGNRRGPEHNLLPPGFLPHTRGGEGERQGLCG